MSDKIRRSFRTTKIKITRENVPSQEQREALEALFITMEAAKTDAVSAERAAGIAAAKAKTKQATAQISELEFLQNAAGHFSQVAGDRLWIVYRDTEGHITLEGFTERLLRNNMRAQQAMLGDQVANSGSDAADREGMYEEVEHPEDEEESN